MKQLLISATFVIAGIAARAQKTDVHFGLKGGVNFASVNVDNGVDFDSRTSFHVGGLAHIHLTRHFALQPEIMYSSQGGKSDIGGTDYKLKLNYVNVPILAQYMVGNGFRLQTGPQVGFLTTAQTKVNETENDSKDAFKNTDFSWTFGASYIGASGIGVDARYNLGISDISEGGSKAQNRVIQVGLFYQFMH